MRFIDPGVKPAALQAIALAMKGMQTQWFARSRCVAGCACAFYCRLGCVEGLGCITKQMLNLSRYMMTALLAQLFSACMWLSPQHVLCVEALHWCSALS